MKYMFPKEFGLHNVFTSINDPREAAQPLQEYTFREDEIQSKQETRSGGKVPRRLRGIAIDLVWKLRRRHQTCPYAELLRHYCPREVR